MTPAPGPSGEAPVLAEVVRSGFVESRHRGSLLALDADGAEVLALGSVGAPCFPRSANKPLQAVGMLRCGLSLSDELLALACASHAGEPFHLDGVRRILALGGFDESALQTPPALPLDLEAERDVVRAGGRPAAIFMNCSGKHAAMLLTCAVNGWDPQTYRQPEHPLQEFLRAGVEELGGETVGWTGVDGCGAPLFALSLRGLARAFVGIATARAGAPARAVGQAMTAHPEYVGGTRRTVTRLMGAVPGLVAKDGAEGVVVAAHPDGRAVALKVEDGSERPGPVMLVAALRRLGFLDGGLDAIGHVAVLGHGTPVGEVRAVIERFVSGD